MNKRAIIILVIVTTVVAFFTWRFIRPLNIFMVTEAFERPVSTKKVIESLKSLSAEECGSCHQETYKEWRTTIHSQAWTDPYFQVDWKFDNSQQICKNCHIPLDRQQEDTVLGFHDKEKWDPILEPNPDFDPKLQSEGVTCAACHLREGKIIGVLGDTDPPHPVKIIEDPNQVCIGCHVVEGDRWDTFFRFPPCGTVAEINSSKGTNKNHQSTAGPITGKTGEIMVPDSESLGCVQCHMPLVERALVAGGKIRKARRHLWRGGHDPDMVKKALKVEVSEVPDTASTNRKFKIILTNVGAAHYLPTGTPDRHLTVHLRLLDQHGKVLQQDMHTLKRTVMWRPFIIDLWDTRLPRWQPREYMFEFSTTGKDKPATLEANVRYHLLDESRRKRINYNNKEPISYDVFNLKIPLE